MNTRKNKFNIWSKTFHWCAPTGLRHCGGCKYLPGYQQRKKRWLASTIVLHSVTAMFEGCQEIGNEMLFLCWRHYCDAIMSTLASKITGVSIVFSSVCSGAYQRKHQSSVSLAFVTGEFPSQRASDAEKYFHLMTSSWIMLYRMSVSGPGTQCKLWNCEVFQKAAAGSIASVH